MRTLGRRGKVLSTLSIFIATMSTTLNAKDFHLHCFLFFFFALIDLFALFSGMMNSS